MIYRHATKITVEIIDQGQTVRRTFDSLDAGAEVVSDAARNGIDEALEVGAIIGQNSSCFVAGTQVMTPDGYRNIEQIVAGEKVIARPEHEPTADTRPQVVEQVFKLKAPVLDLTVDGQLIQTTVEHPFHVNGTGWVAANQLKPGDQLVGHNDVLATVESVEETHREADVYNMRVANDHTYFVGEASWSFSLWVHNTYSPQLLDDGLYGIVDEAGELVKIPGTENPLTFADEAAALDHIATLRNAVPPIPRELFGEEDAIDKLLEAYNIEGDYSYVQNEVLGAIHGNSHGYQFILDHTANAH